MATEEELGKPYTCSNVWVGKSVLPFLTIKEHVMLVSMQMDQATENG